MQSPRLLYLLFFYGSGVTAPPNTPDRYALVHWVSRLSCFLQLRLLRHGSLLCPIAALCSFRPLLRSISPRSQLSICSRAGPRSQHTYANHRRRHLPFRKPALQYSPGSIPLRFVLHSLQPCSVHRLPIIGSPAFPTSAAFAKVLPHPQCLAHGSFVPHFAMQH